MKRLVFCFDGSWNRLDAPHPTNVLFTAQSVRPATASGTSQLIYYDEGVGTEDGQRVNGGLFGAGLDKNLSDAYRYLIFNYRPGDHIFIFGFSRGAYTARSMVGLLNTCGVLARRNARRANEMIGRYRRRNASQAYLDEMLAVRAECSPDVCVNAAEHRWREQNVVGYPAEGVARLGVRYLGVWDTVGSLGIPSYIVGAPFFNRGHQFHDVSLSPTVAYARHAVAIDERRRDFLPTLWDNIDVLNQMSGKDPGDDDAPYQQKWFPGVHGSVGGGGEITGLSDLALDWIWQGARAAGLEFDEALRPLAPSHLAPLENNASRTFNLVRMGFKMLPHADRTPGPRALHEVSAAALRRWREAPDRLPGGRPYRPPALGPVAAELDAAPSGRISPDDPSI